MTLAADLRVLYRLALAPVHGATHAERLESFYRGQATGYDDFRKRLLHGREQLFASLPTPQNGVWIDMGAGTGSNLEFLGDRVKSLNEVYLVDLAPSLLSVARERIAQKGWTNVVTVTADATRFAPPERLADVITFSYSLTMIPDWFAAIEQAWRLLRPGGTIGVVDFYVARKHPESARARHSWFVRHFWPTWFAADNVFPNADHLPYLQRRFETQVVGEAFAPIPYLPLLKAPYYTFVGRKAND
jgi:S-adenosylmethionine-diacylgycerolhomoserine-N-methlytransferase